MSPHSSDPRQLSLAHSSPHRTILATVSANLMISINFRYKRALFAEIQVSYITLLLYFSRCCSTKRDADTLGGNQQRDRLRVHAHSTQQQQAAGRGRHRAARQGDTAEASRACHRDHSTGWWLRAAARPARGTHIAR